MQAHYDVLANLGVPYFHGGESGRLLKKNCPKVVISKIKFSL